MQVARAREMQLKRETQLMRDAWLLTAMRWPNNSYQDGASANTMILNRLRRLLYDTNNQIFLLWNRNANLTQLGYQQLIAECGQNLCQMQARLCGLASMPVSQHSTIPQQLVLRDPIVFRESEMSRKLVSGFVQRGSIRPIISDATQGIGALHFPRHLQSLIIKYLGVHLVRLIHGHYSYRTVLVSHSNRSLRAAALSLSKALAVTSVRFWLRFSALKRIYPVDTARIRSQSATLDNFTITLKDVCCREMDSVDRWVEVPDDLYDGLTVNDLDDLGVQEVLIKCWPGHWPLSSEHRLRLRCHFHLGFVPQRTDFGALRVGDIVDVCDCDRKWYEAVVRFACPSYICVHYIGWSVDDDEKLYAADSARVALRGTCTTGPHKMWKRLQAPTEEVRASAQAAYPALELVADFWRPLNVHR